MGTAGAAAGSCAARTRAASRPAAYRSTACFTKSSVRAASAATVCANAAADPNTTNAAAVTSFLPNITSSWVVKSDSGLFLFLLVLCLMIPSLPLGLVTLRDGRQALALVGSEHAMDPHGHHRAFLGDGVPRHLETLGGIEQIA